MVAEEKAEALIPITMEAMMVAEETALQIQVVVVEVIDITEHLTYLEDKVLVALVS